MDKHFRTSGLAFLSPEAESFEARVVEKHREFFDLFTSANVAAYDLLGRIPVHPERIPASLDERIKLYAVLTFARLCESCQAAAYLAARGFTHDTAVQIRVSLEAFLRLKAFLLNPDLAERILHSDLRRERTTVGLILKGEAGNLDEEPMHRIDLTKKERYLSEQIQARKTVKVRIEDIARETDTLELYQNAYRATSSSVHVSRDSLHEYLEFEEGSSCITSLFHGPRESYIQLHVKTVTEILVMATEMSAQHWGLELPASFSSIVERSNGLAPQVPETP